SARRSPSGPSDRRPRARPPATEQVFSLFFLLVKSVGPSAPHSFFRGLRPRTPGVAGVSPPDPDLLFPRGKSRQKHAREEKPFRWGFSPVTPSSATTQRGARAPLWKPPHDLQWKRLSGLAGPGENP